MRGTIGEMDQKDGPWLHGRSSQADEANTTDQLTMQKDSRTVE